MMFHVIYVSDSMMNADIEAADLAVGERGDLLLLDSEDNVVRNIAAGQWIEWRVADEQKDPING